jgi:hypothetical protein
MGLIELILLAGLLLVLPGAILVYRGFRGRPILSEPACAKCGYDVRSVALRGEKTCPECGADLSGPRAVKFGRPHKRPKMIWAGIALLLLALLQVGGPIGIAMMGIRWDDLRSNESIIANLKTTADSPWDWQRLQRRAQAGKLPREDAQAAIDQLIAHLQDKRARGQAHQGPLPWSKDFVQMVDKRGDIDDAQLARLVDAYYGPSPNLQMPAKVRQGNAFYAHVSYGQHWQLPGLKTLTAVRRVAVDGKEIQPQSIGPRDELSSAGPFGIDAHFDTDSIEPGDHEVIFELDAAIVPETARLRNDVRPGAAHRWPQARHRWTMTAKAPLTVVAKDVQTVERVTDDAFDPIKTAGLRVASVEIQQLGPNLRPTVVIEHRKGPVPLLFNARLRVGDQEIALNRSGSSSGSIENQTYQSDVRSLPADLKEVDVILDPDLRSAESMLTYDKLWAKPVIFERVPVTSDDRATPASEP